MSVALMTEIWKTCIYRGATLSVLIILADHGHDNGSNAYPGVDLIAAKARLSERAVQDALRSLEEDGAIVPEGGDTPSGGRGKLTRYFIDLKRVQELHRLHVDDDPDCKWCRTRARAEARNGAFRDRKGALHARKGADRAAHIEDNHPEPSKNLSDARARIAARWDDIWRAMVAWPIHQAGWSQSRTRLIAERIADQLPEPDILIACIQAQGHAITEANRKRSSDPVRIAYPHNWLERDKGWEQFLSSADAPKRIAEGVAKASAIREALGEELVEKLCRAGLPAKLIDQMEGVTFHPGPPPVLVAGAYIVRCLAGLEPRLWDVFGAGLKIVTARRAA